MSGATTNAGLLADLKVALAESGSTAWSQFSIGTGTTAPAVTDTGMQTVVASWNSGSDYKNFDSGITYDNTTSATAPTATFTGTVGASQANGNTLSEVGIFNTDSSKKMLFRGGGFSQSKNSSIVLVFSWTERKSVA